MPMLLSDTGKMSLQEWNDFCNTIDEASNPVGKSIEVARLTGIVNPLLPYLVDTAISKISQTCASASNQDEDLTLTLKGILGHSTNFWYIEVALLNVPDIDNPVHTVTAASAVKMPVAVATAIPVSTASPTMPGPAPKKYIKDEAGNLTLNPEYKAWKLSQ